MIIKVGLENNFEGRSLAWALEYPGCFAHGGDAETALAAMPAALEEYARWIASHHQEMPGGECDDQAAIRSEILSTSKFEIVVDETFDVYGIDQNCNIVGADPYYEVNSWFRHDWKPLTTQDVGQAICLLQWSRADLLEAVKGVRPQELGSVRSYETRRIADILRHLGGAEWWYLDRLDLAFPRHKVPEEPFERLVLVRERLLGVLPTLVSAQRVVGVSGEFWSPRKLIRRAIWHERDHTAHILKLLH